MSVQPRILAVAALITAAAALLSGPSAYAQGERASMIEEIVTVGTRRQDGRSATDSLVPVDVITGNDLMTQGATDMDRLLANLVPSYNINQQPINDAATLIRPAQLRGLPPDSALVLVNGKRRHRAAVISFLGNGVTDGSQGPDISAIPSIALEKIEVLRDGASAQYGSDAIAGVINFILKDSAEGGRVEARWGQFYEGDGDLVSLAANRGFPLGDDGFANFSVEYKQSDRTDRSQQRDDAIDHIGTGSPAAQAILDSGYPHTFHPNVQIWGAPELEHDLKVFGNFGKGLSGGMEAYGHLSYAARKVEGGFYYRNPHTRGGVFEGDGIEETMTEGDGDAATTTTVTVPNVRVADLHVHNTGMAAAEGEGCPEIKITNGVADAAAIDAVRNDPNCESFITRFPGGFVPRFGGELDDFSVMFGVRGEVGEWHLDASGVYGRQETEFFMRHTINPQLLAKPGITAANIPTDYTPGTYTQTDYTLNLDLVRSIDIASFEEPMNFAIGFEHRQEQFEVTPGGENSWFQDRCPGRNDEFLVTSRDCPEERKKASLATAQGFGIGSNGFTGFGPTLAGTWSRDSNAAYVDMEVKATEVLTFGLAARYEDHNDIGETTDGKISARLDISDDFAVRGAVNTGFRAPTPGQANVLNVTTAFSGGRLVNEATVPPTHPAAEIVGGKPLTPEESNSFTVGAVFNWGLADFTLDFFHIKLKDRIARSSEKELTDDQKMLLANRGIDDAEDFTEVRFYTNDFDTTTSGIDLVVTWQADMFRGTTDFILAANWTETEVDKRNPDVIGDRRVIQLEDNLPRTRMTLSANHAQGDWNFLTRIRYYGGFTEFPTDDDISIRLDADARTLVDLEVSWLVNDEFTVIFGGDNVFDTYPAQQEANNGNVAGLRYAETSPYGFNGGYYYLRGLWDF